MAENNNQLGAILETFKLIVDPKGVSECKYRCGFPGSAVTDKTIQIVTELDQFPIQEATSH
ncbi:MAG: hypothetical protein M5R42_18030 [Rhodocyclaceae bacterium]|nr:hypothetical protein [Rhodocyclaceae bacterium]